MGLFSCCENAFKVLSRAAAKSSVARLRRLGGLPVYTDWAARAAICERCHLRVIRAGVSYCGKPLLAQIQREPLDGCGCPTHAKATSPSEHCPLNSAHEPAVSSDDRCDCKWCALSGKPGT